MVNPAIRLIPNLLSAIRLGLGISFPFCPEQFWIWLIICGGGSDFLDGWVARKYNASSWQGGLLDAVADKVFVLSVLGSFAWSGIFSPWWIPAVISRDLVVALTAAYAALRKSWSSFRDMDARWSGKLATTGQFVLLLVVVLFPHAISSVLYLTVSASFIAAFDYGALFVKALVHR